MLSNTSERGGSLSASQRGLSASQRGLSASQRGGGGGSNSSSKRVASYVVALLLLSLLGLGLYTSTSFFPDDLQSYYKYYDSSSIDIFGGATTDADQGQGDAPSSLGGANSKNNHHELEIVLEDRVARALDINDVPAKAGNYGGEKEDEKVDWKQYQQMTIGRNGKQGLLPMSSPFGGDSLNASAVNMSTPIFHSPHDMTRNVPRIQDFVVSQQAASRAQRTFAIPPPEEAETTTTSTTADDTNNQQETNNNNGGSENKKKKKDERLNIVLFYADDWTMKVLGKLNPHVQTPNIDEMADKGMLFTHNCVTTSICWISRATLATGVYAAVHRQVKIGNTRIFNETVQWPQTLYPLLKANGYYTGLVGKWHAPAPGVFMKYTFDVMNIYYGKHWYKRDNKDRHVTDLNGEDALAFLQQRPNKDQPFALTVSFFATHAHDYHDPPYVYNVATAIIAAASCILFFIVVDKNHDVPITFISLFFFVVYIYLT